MRRLKTGLVHLLCLGILTLTGCGDKDLSKPPKIAYGRDSCAQCRMILQDERFACAAVSVERRYLKFDDIGCLAEHEKEQAARDLRSWVRDADTGWVAKEQAHFVYFKDLVTPMGFGFAAFASAESAEKFAKDKGGRVISWNEILSLNQGENLQPEEAK